MVSTKKLIRSIKKQTKSMSLTPIGTDIIIPNHSGDLSAGHVSTPINSGDLVNKQYVDDNSYVIGSIDDHTDVDTTTDTPSKNEVLKWNGTNWVPAVYNASFTFSISGFSDSQSSTQLIGTGVWKAAGAISFTASYSNGPPEATPYISHTGWSNLDMTGAGYVGPTTSTEAQNYPGAVGSLSWTLHATDGETPDTDVESVTFVNYLWYGVTSKTDTFLEADIEGGTSILSNDGTRTWPSITTGVGEYMLICYPSRLGAVTFWVGGFEGGFESSETVSVTNSAGFTENYYAYRSTNSNLGATVVTTT